MNDRIDIPTLKLGGGGSTILNEIYQKLTDEETDRDQLVLLQGQVNNIVDQQFLGQELYISFHFPTPKGGFCRNRTRQAPTRHSQRILQY